MTQRDDLSEKSQHDTAAKMNLEVSTSAAQRSSPELVVIDHPMYPRNGDDAVDYLAKIRLYEKEIKDSRKITIDENLENKNFWIMEDINTKEIDTFDAIDSKSIEGNISCTKTPRNKRGGHLSTGNFV